MRHSRKPGLALGLVGACALLVAPASAQAPAPPPQQVEDIVVTAIRSGIPVWRVTGSHGTVVLVGAIEGVAKDTKWNPAQLTEALRKSNRVMFPSAVAFTASPFSMVGWVVKWKRMATLPKGHSLAQYLPPAQFQRLVALRKRGVLKDGFERRHPLHLANDLRDYAKGRSGYGQDAGQYVRAAVKKHKIHLVPIARAKAKPVVNDLFASSPRDHLPCLVDSIALAEAGPGAVKARSDAWAERRVPTVLASPAERVFHSCWPADIRPSKDGAQMQAIVRGLLDDPHVTVAVFSLATLASRGGVLDDLQARGADISGPAWR